MINPFGLEMPGRSLSLNGAYRYGFNGKEKDNSGEFGTIAYDYGFRIYDPTIARFLSVDPLTKSYPMLTPYQFASNSPIWAIDLDGLEAMVAIFQDSEDFGYQQVIRVYDSKENSQTIASIRRDYPGLPTSGAVNILLDKDGNFVGKQTVPEIIMEGHYSLRERKFDDVMEGFKQLGRANRDFFIGQDKGNRVARKMVGGIVAAALVVPTGGGSLEYFGVLELGLAVNDVKSGVDDARTSEETVDSNAMRDLLVDNFGEEAGMAFETFAIGTSLRGAGVSMKQGIDNIIEFKDKEAVYEFMKSIKGTVESASKSYDLKKSIDDNKKKD